MVMEVDLADKLMTIQHLTDLEFRTVTDPDNRWSICSTMLLKLCNIIFVIIPCNVCLSFSVNKIHALSFTADIEKKACLNVSFYAS